MDHTLKESSDIYDKHKSQTDRNVSKGKFKGSDYDYNDTVVNFSSNYFQNTKI